MLTGTIFLFCHFLLKKKSIPVFYPLIFLLFFILVGATRDIYSKTTNELIVYNTPGSSTIGIRTGKILNLYSDTSVVAPEVKRHCATLGLKVKTVLLSSNYYCIKSDHKKILITNFLNEKIIRNFVPDIVVLTGSRPEIEKDLNFKHLPCDLIISSAAIQRFQISQQATGYSTDSIFFVRKSGAFIKKI
jgi:hypothetical protein